LPIVEVVTILWTIPLFVLVLSTIFLKESVGILRWFATMVGFLGLAFITLYDSDVSFSFKFIYLIPAASALLFAVQDVMIKKMIDKDDRVTMLLYFAVVTSALTLVPALYVWITPTAFELIMLMFYGLFANVMQYFIFRAFEATDLSALAPYRYVEFLISALAGFMFFAESPGINVLLGACILIPSTLYLAYSEKKKAKKKLELASNCCS
jgi:S-adenosylmethionine uptake transporter